MTDRIPVNPEMLKWARETGGYSVEDVAARLKRKRITSETVKSWEKGTNSPTYVQLERLAYEIYQRPMALFFFPQPPEEEPPAESFRTLPKEEIDLLEPRLLYLVRQARVMQENLKELFDGVNPAEKQIWLDITINTHDSIADVCRAVRQNLGITLDNQYAFNSNREALKYWRSVLENNGVFVFKSAFKDEETSGLCLFDETFPVICVNNSQPKIRQIFTLFHELAHLLFKTGGVDFRHDEFIRNLRGYNKRVEIFCNKFAGELLVPTKDIRPQLCNRRITDDLLLALAKKYSVSREVILRKCLDLDYITEEFYRTKVKTWREEAEKRKSPNSGGNPYNTQRSYLGTHYVERAFAKYYQGLITKSQLAGYLGMKEDKMNKFEHYVMTTGGHT